MGAVGKASFASSRISGWFKRTAAPAVEAGRFYRRRVNDQVTETAEVLYTSFDQMQIPHVHYMVKVERKGGPSLMDGPRTLNLDTFQQRYAQRVEA